MRLVILQTKLLGDFAFDLKARAIQNALLGARVDKDACRSAVHKDTTRGADQGAWSNAISRGDGETGMLREAWFRPKQYQTGGVPRQTNHCTQ